MALAAVPNHPKSVASEPRRNYGKIIEQTWIWSAVGYTVLRIVIAWGAFGEHGVNIWVFGIIDLVTAWPYAKSIAVIVRRSAHSEWRRLPGPIVVAVSTFFAPYAYIWFAAGEMPSDLRVGMVILVASILVAAAVGVVFKARKMRVAQRESDLVIDLTDSGEPQTPQHLAPKRIESASA